MLKNIGYTLFRQVLSTLISVGSVILLGRYLGAEGMGKYALAVLIPQFLITVLNFGLPSSLVFFIASKRYEAYSALGHINRFFLYFIPGIVTVVGGVLLLFSDRWFPELDFISIVLAIAAIPFMLAQIIQIAVIQGLEKFKSLNILILIQPLVLFLGLLMLLVFESLIPTYALIMFLVSQIAGWYLTKLQVSKEVQGIDGLSNQDQNLTSFLKENFGYGLKAYFSNITAMINYRADLYLVGLLANATSTGIYAVALQISEKLFIISQATSTVIMPRLSSMHGDRSMQDTITGVVAKWSFFLTIIGGAGIYFIAKWFLASLLGETYSRSLNPLTILIVAACLSSYSRVLSNSISAKNKPEWNLYIGLITSIVNVLMNVIFIPKYGLLGAAGATLVSFAIDFILKVFVYVRLFKTDFASLLSFSFERKLFRKYIAGYRSR